MLIMHKSGRIDRVYSEDTGNDHRAPQLNTTPPLPYRVLIVDDVPAVRAALRWTLDEEPDLHVVGEASDGGEAIRQAATLRPDLVILDLQSGGLNGDAATRAQSAVALACRPRADRAR